MNEKSDEIIVFDTDEACLHIQKGIKKDTGRDIAIETISLILEHEVGYMQSIGIIEAGG